MASQNMYDNDLFFAKYSEFPRAVRGETGASEWPELQQMLPADLRGRRVLDLACGEGWFARWCVARGARAVDACDLSVNMLRKAEGRTRTAKLEADKRSATAAAAAVINEKGALSGGGGGNGNGNSNSNSNSNSTTTNNNSGGPGPVINFARVDLEKLQLRASAYELVFSGLALHYVRNLAGCVAQVHAALAPGGLFVFSVEHPLLTAPTRPGFIKAKAKAGSGGNGGGGGGGAAAALDQWPVDSYFAEGERSVHWLVGGVKKQHRTLSSYFSLLVAAGFEVVKMDEWGAAAERSRKHPDWVEGVCPRFLMVMARKKGEPDKKRVVSGTRR